MLIDEIIYSNGDSFMEDLHSAISRAQKTIHLETYIFDQDPSGKRLLEQLVQAAGRGVQGFRTGVRSRNSVHAESAAPS